MQSQKRASRPKKAQMPMEIIAMAVVLVGLLLLVLVTTYYKNIQTQQIMEMSENSIQCNEMSTIIARMHSNRATTREIAFLATESNLRRVEKKPGGIRVGEISCSYIGKVEKTTGESDTDPGGTGTTGITLSTGEWCFEKSDGKIEISGIGEGRCD